MYIEIEFFYSIFMLMYQQKDSRLLNSENNSIVFTQIGLKSKGLPL